MYDAGTKETTNYTTSIDLQQSLEDLAALVRERTGLTIQPISVVDDGTIQTG
ncbi:MAG: hypothetical protein HZB38_06960, partial [Planctomycetes bacterium]|nr:hypothetical protein [Planctomycetota bacterium]